ncbi:alcohol dehydrogenase catalytic domain-containing protein [Rhodohalobacter sp. 614A]|uniref:alcohol dehydrogenase catalytic domain-containing protein n=1 Tax=Rhodohalobacter sp. 614A TaxID=2908649 RepID=UPI003F8F04EB
MQQAIITEPRSLTFREVLCFSGISKDEVLLKIKCIGVCGSDIHVFHGEYPAVVYPVIQGHEFSAVVENIGKNVKKLDQR